MKINKKWYQEKVRACWIGKNIGGTMGAPYESMTEMQNISGFTTPKGEPMPNDDLDLQLVWLKAVEERGIQNITPAVLSEYWMSYIPPHWNEYGVAKANLHIGLLPPLSGEYLNDKWKTSNGAWIRTEIWACLFPGFPELAVKYAYKDASIDHGISDGTYAAMFVAALESSAFVESDIRKLIETGLSFIPKDCDVSKSVRLAIECYDNKVDFKDAREKIVEQTRSLGMFQAPGNVGFVILGLLYGEGDFKKTMINTINCGDDTDCTGATVGAILGIIGAGEAIPPDWEEYIGDSIKSCAIDVSMKRCCKSCTELTNRIINLVPVVLGSFAVPVEYTDEKTQYVEKPKFYIPQFDIPTNPYTYDEIEDLVHTKARVEFDKMPLLKSGESIKMTVGFLNSMYDPRHLTIKLILPQGWTADYTRHKRIMNEATASPVVEEYWSADITAGENIDMVNKVYVEVACEGRPVTKVIPVVILG